MNKKKKIMASVIMILALGLLVIFALGQKQEQPASGFAAHRVVAHAMGGIGGHTYTNAFEAFIANYEQGTRVFETDLLLSTDNQLIARHEWTANMSKLLGQTEVLSSDKVGAPLSHDEFMNSPIMNIYSPLDLEKILDLMQHYTDAYIVTDTKEFDSGLIMEQFEMLTEAARTRDSALLERIVPQIYSRAMLDELNNIYMFPTVIYTLYNSKDTDAEVLEFVQNNKVDITMPASRASRDFVQKLKKAGARVYVHTVNEEDQIVKLSRMGVDGFYTDFVAENDLNRIKGLRSSL
ncbi:phosphatidylinositol-specific phospholipase C/glycerophosphodiester phosphodiesterase family protein [Paenibacillus sp. GCM10012306]|uniref:phosphatidylinositol-specific phospholipase C/glycerophosphodiester phosphodiesterase family protein n=1 Tax=Paenibacillus sp. GCM10012306 TaxID=3317342 RepID=UPI003614CBB0